MDFLINQFGNITVDDVEILIYDSSDNEIKSVYHISKNTLEQSDIIKQWFDMLEISNKEVLEIDDLMFLMKTYGDYEYTIILNTSHKLCIYNPPLIYDIINLLRGGYGYQGNDSDKMKHFIETRIYLNI